MKVLVIGCSLNQESKSQVLARQAVDVLAGLGAEAALLDLRQFDIGVFGKQMGDQDVVRPLADAVVAADAVLMAVSIYNYDVNAAAKNLIEHTGSAWEGKIVGFLCAAGGTSSYMAVMGLAGSLMLDFRCWIVPRFVYATGGAFQGGALVSAEVKGRIAELCGDTLRLVRAWGAVGA